MRRHRSKEVLDLLKQFESRNITFVEPDGSWPIVWDRAKGNFVWDVDGKKYLDLTAAFGVAAAGHSQLDVVRAGRAQMSKLLHAMGDVHPHALKAQLARELSRVTFQKWAKRSGSAAPATESRAKVIFCNSGFEAVEAALKTAILATGKPGIVAFRHGYHGLGYGALNATYREHFRRPFLEQLGGFGQFVDFPAREEELDAIERSVARALSGGAGAVLVEPVQTRGGIHVPPPAFLPMLRRLCTRTGALLILDEIYTGFGRTGRWFACEHWQVTPDLICLGKALAGGFPISVCAGRADLMDGAWPPSTGEAIHTSTFLGHPVGCAMALENLRVIGRLRLPERAAELGLWLQKRLNQIRAPVGMALEVRGIGLLAGLDLQWANGRPATDRALQLVKGLLKNGIIALPEGEFSNVIAFTPPLTITQAQLDQAITVLNNLLHLS